MAAYDLREAQQAMFEFGLKTGGGGVRVQMDQAHKEFFAAMVGLTRPGFVDIHAHGDSLLILNFTGMVVLEIRYRGVYLDLYEIRMTLKRAESLSDDQKAPAPLSIVYSAPDEQMIGGLDANVAPEPGKPLPRKSAVGVAMRAACDRVLAELQA